MSYYHKKRRGHYIATAKRLKNTDHHACAARCLYGTKRRCRIITLEHTYCSPVVRGKIVSKTFTARDSYGNLHGKCSFGKTDGPRGHTGRDGRNKMNTTERQKSFRIVRTNENPSKLYMRTVCVRCTRCRYNIPVAYSGRKRA